MPVKRKRKLNISILQKIKRTWDSRPVASRVPCPAVAAAAAVAADIDDGGGDSDSGVNHCGLS